MNETLLILAITVIIIGVLLLAGLAIWLAVDRRRTQATLQSQPIQHSEYQAAGGQRPGQSQPPISPTPARRPAAAQATEPAGGKAALAARPLKDVSSSGEYPAAAIYDQTILPTPSAKRRPRQQSQ